MKKFSLSRRAVLRGAGGVAVGLPLLEAMGPSVARAADAPKRMISVYTPCGTIPKNLWPKKEGADFEITPILKPLEDHKADLLILGGIDNVASTDGPGDAHQKGTGSCLTGAPLQKGEFQGMGGAVAGWADGISIDQYLANEIGGDTVFSSLEFGVGVRGAHVGTRISYKGAGRPVPPESSPWAMYDRIFGDPDASQKDKERAKMRRRLVLDLVKGEADKLNKRLGAADKKKLEAHLDAISDVQNQLNQAAVEFGGQCQPLDLGNEIDVYKDKNIPVVGKLQMDIMALAAACDVTRLMTLMWTYSASLAVYDWLEADVGGKKYPAKTPHHTIAHKGNEETIYVAQNTEINRWNAEQLAYLIDKLKAIPEGDGNVFDNTVILWANEQSTGNDHSRKDMPFVLAGSAGGHFKTGRYIRYAPKPEDRGPGDSGEPHNKLLVSLIQAMG
ncbi:MAG: DUF1552 domain-containing protein, partial [Myxococcales bacterium]|nr:DUF1552 domain-containing protein [Myxococcales bacterium]